MDMTPLVQKILGPEERCLASIEAGLVQGWVKTPRILALIEKCGEYGLLIFRTLRSPIFDSKDLINDSVMPVLPNFKCVIDTSANKSLAADVPVKIASGEKELFFEVPYGSRTNTFLTAVKRSVDTSSFTQTHSWLEYHKPAPSSSLTVYVDNFDPLKTDTGQDALAWVSNPPNSSSDQSSLLGATSSLFTDTASCDTRSTAISDDSVLDMLQSCDERSESMFDGSSMTSSMSKSLDDLDSIGLTADHFGPGTKPVTTNRDRQIQLYMTDREAEFTIKRPMKIYCGTWNVNGQAASVNLNTWLAYDEFPPDIYAIGFQELDLSKEAFIFNDSSRQEDWYKQVACSLHPAAQYRKVRLIRLVGMMLIVFIKTEHVPFVSEVSAESVGTGIMGVMGNKGAVSVRLAVYNSSICFVNSHLAAHTEEYERRNQDVRDINSRLQFSKFDPPLTIAEHDLVFWLGDLNYRIGDLDPGTVKHLIKHEEFTQLASYDQLTRQMQAGRLYARYREAELNFPPTYKYDPGTDNWDTSEKCRVPAWCDRILYCGKHVNSANYRSHPTLRISDHKPVSCLFDVGVKVIDWTMHKKVYEDVMKQLDRIENEFLPQVTLDRVEMSFQKVMFLELQTQYVTIANTGQVPVQFEFINKLDDSSYCKAWLTITPYKRFIMPGESCEVVFEVYVNKTTAPMLNSRDDSIEDILVLHLHGGKDIFISVSGSYVPSCFGSSIEALIHMYGPIREVPTAQLIDLEHISAWGRPENQAEPLDIPKEVWWLVNHIYKSGMQTEDLFQRLGPPTEIQQIRDCLDTGRPDDMPSCIHSVAEALVVFIGSLPEPVVPFSLCQRALDSSNNFFACKQVVSRLPTSHLNVFNYVCAFLRKLLQFSHHNNLDAKFLASLFGSVLVRLPATSDALDGFSQPQKRAGVQAVEKKKACFVHHFLVNEDWNVIPANY